MNTENERKHVTIFIMYFNFVMFVYWWGQAVAQLVEALRYKPEGSGFDSRWCHRNFSFDIILPPQYGPGGDSDCNRNEYQ